CLELRSDGLTVGNPVWNVIPNLVHGVTTRRALPQPGREDLFVSITHARAAGALPDGWTFGGEQVHEAEVAVIREPLEAHQRPEGFRYDEALRVGEFPRTDALVTD